MNAQIALQGDRRQKVLQGLVLLPVKGLLTVLGFLEAQVVLQAQRNCIIQREPQKLIRWQDAR